MKAAKLFLAEQGYDPLYGARPLKRAVQNYVEDILADAIISKKMVMGSKVYSITHKKGEDKLSMK
jgi:ATP-dependent Clp protease ATP-binding subunit ClpA